MIILAFGLCFPIELNDKEQSNEPFVDSITIIFDKVKDTNGLESILSNIEDDLDDFEVDKFINSLSEIQIQFLKLFNQYKSLSINDAKQYAKANGQIIGVLINDINQQSLEFLEDNFIYENEYVYNIASEFRPILQKIY